MDVRLLVVMIVGRLAAMSVLLIVPIHVVVLLEMMRQPKGMVLS